MKQKISRYGIYEIIPFTGKEADENLSIFKTKEERDEVWDMYTEYYRTKRSFKKVVVEITMEEE